MASFAAVPRLLSLDSLSSLWWLLLLLSLLLLLLSLSESPCMLWSDGSSRSRGWDLKAK
jgi:hypothetical protein